MRVGIIAPPFITVPPATYGGTELFIDVLIRHLAEQDVDVVLYTNGESTIPVEKRFLYPHSEWPVTDLMHKELKELHHVAWAIEDASRCCDVIHIHSPAPVTLSLFTKKPIICTIHHPHVEYVREHYLHNSSVTYVSISEFQRQQHAPLESQVIYHGLDLKDYRLVRQKQNYVCWLGRISALKGARRAIEFARSTGVPLKLAGDVQPIFRKYFEEHIQPEIDGDLIQYVGEVDLEAKNELLGNASALLFPIDWEEPFGLVMVEAMACGTPVLALRRGSVPEIVDDRISGFVCESVNEMVDRLDQARRLDPHIVRSCVEARFSAQRMAADYAQLYRQVSTGSEVDSTELVGR